MTVSSGLAALYRRDITRLTQEIAAFPDTDSLWQTRAGVSNSAGNLALHLEGNLREFIGRQLGGVPYTRDRRLEFGQSGLSVAEILGRLEPLCEAIPAIVALLPEEVLDRAFPTPMFGADLPTHQALVHLLGHINYHMGQIDMLRRFLTGKGALELTALPSR